MINIRPTAQPYSAIKITIAALGLLFWLFPNSPLAYDLHLDRPELFNPGALKLSTSTEIVAAGFVVWLLYSRSLRFQTGARFIWILVGVYLATLAASIATDSNNTTLVLTCTLVSGSFAVGLLCAFLCGSARTTLGVVGFAGVVSAATATFEFMHKHNVMVSGTIIRAGGAFDQPLELANTVLIVLPILLFFGSEPGGGTMKNSVWLLGASVTLGCILLTVSRGPIAAAIAACVYLCIEKRDMRTIATVMLAFATVCLIADFVRIQGVENRSSTDRSNMGRIAVWKDGLDVFAKHPLTGVGPGALNIPIHPEYMGMTVNEAAVHTSNLALQWLDELGISGGILLFLLARGITLTLRQSADPIARPLAAAWVGLGLAGVLDVPFGTSLMLGPTMMVGAVMGATLIVRQSAATSGPDPLAPKGCDPEYAGVC